MTPKEKAEELFDKFKDLTLNVEHDDDQNNFTAKQCALMAVNELMKAPHDSHYYAGFIPEDAEPTDFFWDEFENFWNEVKQEIEKI